MVDKNGRELIGVLQMNDKQSYVNYVKHKLRNSLTTTTTTSLSSSWNLDLISIEEVSRTYSTADALIRAIKEDNNKQVHSILHSPLTQHILYQVLSLYDTDSIPTFLYIFKLGKIKILHTILNSIPNTNKRVFKQLFELETKDGTNATYIHIAVKNNKLSLIKELIELSQNGSKYKDFIDLQRGNSKGDVALDLAIQSENYQMIKVLYSSYGNKDDGCANRVLSRCVNAKDIEFEDRFNFFQQVIKTSGRFINAKDLMRHCYNSQVKEREFFKYMIENNHLFTKYPLCTYDVWNYIGKVCDSEIMEQMLKIKLNGVGYVCTLCYFCLF